MLCCSNVVAVAVAEKLLSWSLGFFLSRKIFFRVTAAAAASAVASAAAVASG